MPCTPWLEGALLPRKGLTGSPYLPIPGPFNHLDVYRGEVDHDLSS